MTTSAPQYNTNNPIINLPLVPLCRIVEFAYSTNILETSKSHPEERQYIRDNLTQNAPKQVYDIKMWDEISRDVRLYINKKRILVAFLPLIISSSSDPNHPIENAIQQYIDTYAYSRKYNEHYVRCGYGKCNQCHVRTYVLNQMLGTRDVSCRECLHKVWFSRESPFTNILMVRNLRAQLVHLIKDAVCIGLLSPSHVQDVIYQYRQHRTTNIAV